MIADDLKKIVRLIGERNGSSEAAANNLTRTASMIEGLLGPGNTGYKVRRDPRPGGLAADPSDPPREKPGLARRLGASPPTTAGRARREPKRMPPASPPRSPPPRQWPATPRRRACISFSSPTPTIPNRRSSKPPPKFREMAGSPRKPCSASRPWAPAKNSGSARATPTPRRWRSPTASATVRGAEVVCLGEDADLASMLFEMGLPAVRVATRPIVTADEPDDQAALRPHRRRLRRPIGGAHPPLRRRPVNFPVAISHG